MTRLTPIERSKRAKMVARYKIYHPDRTGAGVGADAGAGAGIGQSMASDASDLADDQRDDDYDDDAENRDSSNTPPTPPTPTRKPLAVLKKREVHPLVTKDHEADEGGSKAAISTAQLTRPPSPAVRTKVLVHRQRQARRGRSLKMDPSAAATAAAATPKSEKAEASAANNGLGTHQAMATTKAGEETDVDETLQPAVLAASSSFLFMAVPPPSPSMRKKLLMHRQQQWQGKRTTEPPAVSTASKKAGAQNPEGDGAARADIPPSTPRRGARAPAVTPLSSQLSPIPSKEGGGDVGFDTDVDETLQPVVLAASSSFSSMAVPPPSPSMRKKLLMHRQQQWQGKRTTEPLAASTLAKKAGARNPEGDGAAGADIPPSTPRRGAGAPAVAPLSSQLSPSPLKEGGGGWGFGTARDRASALSDAKSKLAMSRMAASVNEKSEERELMKLARGALEGAAAGVPTTPRRRTARDKQPAGAIGVAPMTPRRRSAAGGGAAQTPKGSAAGGAMKTPKMSAVEKPAEGESERPPAVAAVLASSSAESLGLGPSSSFQSQSEKMAMMWSLTPRRRSAAGGRAARTSKGSAAGGAVKTPKISAVQKSAEGESERPPAMAAVSASSSAESLGLGSSSSFQSQSEKMAMMWSRGARSRSPFHKTLVQAEPRAATAHIAESNGATTTAATAVPKTPKRHLVVTPRTPKAQPSPRADPSSGAESGAGRGSQVASMKKQRERFRRMKAATAAEPEQPPPSSEAAPSTPRRGRGSRRPQEPEQEPEPVPVIPPAPPPRTPRTPRTPRRERAAAVAGRRPPPSRPETGREHRPPPSAMQKAETAPKRPTPGTPRRGSRSPKDAPPAPPESSNPPPGRAPTMPSSSPSSQPNGPSPPRVSTPDLAPALSYRTQRKLYIKMMVDGLEQQALSSSFADAESAQRGVTRGGGRGRAHSRPEVAER